MTLIHPSSTKLPESCETRITKIGKTYWIPLHLSNQWLYVAPKPEKLSTICNENVNLINIQERCKLTLQQGFKAYTSNVTLYAMTTIKKNVSNDFLCTVPMDFECCLVFEKKTRFF